MEDWLETNRTTARFNLGESGGRARTVGELLSLSGVLPHQAAEQFLQTSLKDSPNWGHPELRARVAGLHPGAGSDNVLITTGTSEALFLLFRRLRPRNVALAMPAFQLLYEIPQSLSARITSLPVEFTTTGKAFIDEDRWLKILDTHSPDCVVINHPHNPSGLTLSDDFLEALISWTAHHGATLIGDEHYRFLASDTQILGPTLYRTEHEVRTRALSLGIHAHLPQAQIFVTGSYIKCLGAPGLRLGWCVGPNAILKDLQNEKNYTTHTVNPLSEWISTEVLRDLHSPLFTQARMEWRANRELMASWLASSSRFVGQAPQGGLVSCVTFANTLAHTLEADNAAKVFAALAGSGVFLLPLESMEFSKVEHAQEVSTLARGCGFRMGLGADPANFSTALGILEMLAEK